MILVLVRAAKSSSSVVVNHVAKRCTRRSTGLPQAAFRCPTSSIARKAKCPSRHASTTWNMDTVEANHALGFKADMRDYGIGIQILKDLGLSRIRLLTNNPKKSEAFNLRGFNLEVVDQVPILPPVNEHNAQYLETKRKKMGHQLPLK